MSDEIIGTSVLAGDNLYICAYSPTFQGGFPHWTSIPVVPEGSPEIPHPFWRYRREGNLLHCHPSLHIQGGEPKRTLFHNGGTWSTPFVEFVDRGDGKDACDWCMDLNRDEVRRRKGLAVIV